MHEQTTTVYAVNHAVSVCLSVTCVYCEITKLIIMQLALDCRDLRCHAWPGHIFTYVTAEQQATHSGRAQGYF